jgi:hypothetical protein
VFMHITACGVAKSRPLRPRTGPGIGLSPCWRRQHDKKLRCRVLLWKTAVRLGIRARFPYSDHRRPEHLRQRLPALALHRRLLRRWSCLAAPGAATFLRRWWRFWHWRTRFGRALFLREHRGLCRWDRFGTAASRRDGCSRASMAVPSRLICPISSSRDGP